MKEITMFYLTGCPYCRQAEKAMQALYAENPAYAQIPIKKIEETQNPGIAEKYDYYYVPTMFIGQDKLYEAKPGEGFDECLSKVRAVFEKAME